MMKRILFFLLVVACSLGVRGQQNELGVVVGSFNGLSYKRFISPTLAIQTDLAFGVQATQGSVYLEGEYLGPGHENYWDFVLNPNLLYQYELASGFSVFSGGGLSLGVAEEFGLAQAFGKFGLNAMLGAEYRFAEAPIALSFDFRPGYGVLFGNIEGYSFSCHLFDWRLALGVRYRF